MNTVNTDKNCNSTLSFCAFETPDNSTSHCRMVPTMISCHFRPDFLQISKNTTLGKTTPTVRTPSMRNPVASLTVLIYSMAKINTKYSSQFNTIANKTIMLFFQYSLPSISEPLLALIYSSVGRNDLKMISIN